MGETGSHAKRHNSTHVPVHTDRRRYAQWFGRWFGHVQRTDVNDGPHSPWTRRQGRSKKAWHEHTNTARWVWVLPRRWPYTDEWGRWTRPPPPLGDMENAINLCKEFIV